MKKWNIILIFLAVVISVIACVLMERFENKSHVFTAFFCATFLLSEIYFLFWQLSGLTKKFSEKGMGIFWKVFILVSDILGTGAVASIMLELTDVSYLWAILFIAVSGIALNIIVFRKIVGKL